MKKINTSAAVIDGRLEKDGFVFELDGGRISSVTHSHHEGPFSRCIAVPGLIQMHIHLCQTIFRGLAEGRTLLRWLTSRIWPLEASHSADTLATSVILSLRELVRSGCTGLMDMGSVENSAVTIDILRRSGIRALAGNTLMDKGPEYICRDLDWLKEETSLARNLCGDLVSHAITPRFALSCSDDLWAWVAGEKGVRTTHAAESPDELDDPEVASGKGNIHYLGKRGFLGRNTFLTHCIHLQKNEMELLRDTSTSVVHCPWTNLRLGSGIADTSRLASNGIRIFVGSDGAACNNRLDLSGDLRLAMALAAMKRGPEGSAGGFWLARATSSAAEALGWENCGVLAPGYSADLVLLEPDELEWEELDLSEDPVRYLLEMDWPSRTRLTMVNGRVVYRDGDFPTLPPLPLPPGEARAILVNRAGKLTGEPF